MKPKNSLVRSESANDGVVNKLNLIVRYAKIPQTLVEESIAREM